MIERTRKQNAPTKWADRFIADLNFHIASKQNENIQDKWRSFCGFSEDDSLESLAEIAIKELGVENQKVFIEFLKATYSDDDIRIEEGALNGLEELTLLLEGRFQSSAPAATTTDTEDDARPSAASFSKLRASKKRSLKDLLGGAKANDEREKARAIALRSADARDAELERKRQEARLATASASSILTQEQQRQADERRESMTHYASAFNGGSSDSSDEDDDTGWLID